MKKIKNLFPKIYDFENLFYAYKDGIKQKRDRPDVMAYTEKLEENLRKACLVLIKDADADWGFRILTSYPMFERQERQRG